jgi:hypothetical protein
MDSCRNCSFKNGGHEREREREREEHMRNMNSCYVKWVLLWVNLAEVENRQTTFSEVIPYRISTKSLSQFMVFMGKTFMALT